MTLTNQLVEITGANEHKYFTYDKQGNTIKEEANTGNNNYEYNTLNQQIRAVTKEGNTLISYYDAEGLRYEIEENEKLSSFIYNKENTLVELDKDENVVSRFTRGYEVVAADIDEERYYYSCDEQGSTIAISDKDEVIKNYYHYDGFGNILSAEENVHNRIKYTGQQFDIATNQYYLRARYYNPIIGRFTQEDIYRGDGLNLYAYCGNNPVEYCDFSGYARKKKPFDLGDLHYDDIETGVGGKSYNEILTGYVGGPSPDMVDPHAHHIVFKIGLKEKQKKLVRELQEILYFDYGINPIEGKEVLGWAPNRGAKGQHSYETLKALGDEIKNAKNSGASYDDIVEILNKHKDIAANRKSTYVEKKKRKNGKC